MPRSITSLASGLKTHVVVRCSCVGLVAGLIVATPDFGPAAGKVYTTFASNAQRAWTALSTVGPNAYLAARADADAAAARSKALAAAHLAAW
jgi:hypothetical protein